MRKDTRKWRYPKGLSFLFVIGLSFSLGVTPLALNSSAVPISSVPDPRLDNAWVVDMVDLLSPDTEDQLNQLFSDLETKNGDEMVVVTVLDTQTFLQPGDFASKLKLTWGLGENDSTNGILILISQKENTTSIDMGGIRRLFTGNQYQELVASLDEPLSQENFEANLVTVAQAIINKLEEPTVDLPDTVEQPPTSDAEEQDDFVRSAFLLVLFGILIAISLLGRLIGPFMVMFGQALFFVCQKAYHLIKK